MIGLLSIVKQHYPSLDDKIKYEVRITTGKFDFSVCDVSTKEKARDIVEQLQNDFSSHQEFENQKRLDLYKKQIERISD